MGPARGLGCSLGGSHLRRLFGDFESKPIKVRHFIYARSKRGGH